VAGYALEDLSQRPIQTGPFPRLWGWAPWDGEARFRFPVSPGGCGRRPGPFPRGPGPDLAGREAQGPLQAIKAVNQVTREVLPYWETGSFLAYPTANRWEKTVRRSLWHFLTRTAHLPGREARALMKGGVPPHAKDPGKDGGYGMRSTLRALARRALEAHRKHP